MTDQELARTIGAAMVSSLPVFAVFVVNKRITKEFNKGWYGAVQDKRVCPETKNFRCSWFWWLPFSLFTLGLLSLIIYYLNQDSHLRFLAFLALPITIFFLIGTIYSISLSIEITDAKIVFKNIFRKSEVKLNSIQDVKCLTGYLVITNFEGKAIKTPLIYNNLFLLGQTLRNALP